MASLISDNNRRIIKNTLFLYMRMFVILIISLFTSRVVFRTLGIDNYGIYNVVGSIIVFFTFITDGLLGATKRFITAELAIGNEQSLKHVFTTALNAHFLIAAMILIAGETIGVWFLNNMINIPDERMLAANVVFQFSVLSSVLMIIQSPYNGALIANERMAVYSYFSIIDVVSKLLIILFIQLLPGDKLIIYAALMFGISIVNFLINVLFVRHLLPMCRYCRYFDKQTFKSMFNYTGWTLFGSGAYIMTNQGVAVLINWFFGVAVNAALGVSNTITNIVSKFVKDFQVAFSPQITKYYVAKDEEELNKLVIRASRYSSYLILVFMVPICFEASDLLTLWLGDYPKYSVEFCVITLFCIYLESISAPMGAMITSDTNIKFYQLLLSTCYLLNFVICLIILCFMSIPYVVVIVRFIVDIGLVIVRLLSAIKIFECFRWKEWVVMVLFNAIVILIPVLLFVPVMYSFLIENIWLRLILWTSILVAILVASIFFIGLNRRERSLICSKLRFNLVL